MAYPDQWYDEEGKQKSCVDHWDNQWILECGFRKVVFPITEKNMIMIN